MDTGNRIDYNYLLYQEFIIIVVYTSTPKLNLAEYLLMFINL